MKEIFRRSVALLMVPILAVFMAACSFSSAMSQVQKYLPVGLNAFEAVVQVLVSAGVLGTPYAAQLNSGAEQVKSDFADVMSAVSAYQAAPSTSKATDLGKVMTALSVVQADLAKFESDAHVNDTRTQATVAAAIGTISTALAAIQANLGTAAVGARAKAPLPSPSGFKHEFNGILAAGGFPQFAIR